MKLRQPFTFVKTVPTPQDDILADEAQLVNDAASCCEAAFSFTNPRQEGSHCNDYITKH